jgi:hypothetical protein
LVGSHPQQFLQGSGSSQVLLQAAQEAFAPMVFTHKSQLDVMEHLMAVTCFVASTHLCKYQVGCKLLPCEGGAGTKCTAADISGICQLMIL